MTTDEHGPEVTPPSTNPAPQLREAITLGVLGILTVAGFVWWTSRTDDPAVPGGRGATTTPPPEVSRADFVGNDACAECHPAIAVHQERHGHHRTLRRAADRRLARELDGRRVPDPERPDVWWTFLLQDDRFAVERREGDRVDRLPIDFAFGSGYHATTFVSLLEDDPEHPVIREHRLTILADRSVQVTPGQESPHPPNGTDTMGRIVADELALSCFRCHVTLPSADDLGVLDVSSMIPSVTCERCHGPGRSHIQAARFGDDPHTLAMPFGPGRESTESQMSLCGTCHRHPSQAPPGAIRPDNAEIARFQPVGLMQSACYTRSNGSLSCTTCHNPHQHPEPGPASYTPTCLSCHAPAHPEQVTCPVSPSQDCTTCHMPRVDAGQGVRFADHWIRVWEDLPTPSLSPATPVD